MTQTAIPFLFFRAGTSRGPFLRRSDLPEDRETLAQVLIAMLGAGHTHNIDGIGGGTAVTTKVAMLSKSNDPWAQIDYFFAQVSVTEQTVDFKPTCGNMLAGVGPAAIEMGLVDAQEGTTSINIHAVNTGARITSTVQTPGGELRYDGATAIDGVPGTAAPIRLQFMDTVGSVTGAFQPTGQSIDRIDGIDVTCMDVAMPMVIARATDFGLTGYESAAELDNNPAFYERMQSIRIQAGQKMGMGDVSGSVTPKFAVIAAARHGGTLTARYFMPWKCHPTMAVTGAQCLASCGLAPGTVADGLANLPAAIPAAITLEHPSGQIDVLVDYESVPDFTIKSAGLTRTARKLVSGEVYVPRAVWQN